MELFSDLSSLGGASDTTMVLFLLTADPVLDLGSDSPFSIGTILLLFLLMADPDLTGFSSILSIVKVSIYPSKSTFWSEAPKCTEFNYCLSTNGHQIQGHRGNLMIGQFSLNVQL